MIQRILRGLKTDKLVRLVVDDAVWPARVHDLSQGGIWMSLPEESGQMASPEVGTPVTITYHDEYGRYRFTSPVIQCHAGLQHLFLAWPQEVDRIQKREAFRLDIRIEARWWLPEPKQWVRGRTRDLSAGGALLVGTGLPDPVRVILSLPRKEVRVKARVVKVDGGATGVEFIDLSRSDSEAISKLILEEQRRRRRMGLL